MKSHCQRFNETEFLGRELRRVQLFCRHYDEFSECTISLHTERLVKLAGIWTSAPTRSAFTATCVRRQSHIGSGGQPTVAAWFDDGRAHFMSQDSWKRDQRVQPTKRIQVASAEAHHPYFQQYVSAARNGLWDAFDRCVPWLLEYERFHNSSSVLMARESRFRLYGTVLSAWVTAAPEPRPNNTHVALN